MHPRASKVLLFRTAGVGPRAPPPWGPPTALGGAPGPLAAFEGAPELLETFLASPVTADLSQDFFGFL